MFGTKIAGAAAMLCAASDFRAGRSRERRLALLVFCFVMVAVAAPSRAADTLIAEVNGMVCAFCAQGIERKLRKQAQTQDVYVNLGQRVVALQLKDGQTFSASSFKSVIEDAGYAVIATRNDARSVQEIKAAFSKK